MNKTSFSLLPIGTQFDFDRTGFENSGMATGPWIKVSARKYRHVSNGMLCKIGSARCTVLTATV